MRAPRLVKTADTVGFQPHLFRLQDSARRKRHLPIAPTNRCLLEHRCGCRKTRICGRKSSAVRLGLMGQLPGQTPAPRVTLQN